MLIPKPPIVVLLGHVDHGKTTLLDAILKTNIALKEKGAITQKISAYQIEFNKQNITFIDTPGHLAFHRLRQRGAKVADIGILVIASDEGIKEQTIESLEYIKSLKLPFLVALTKIDKKESNPEKVISQLIEKGVVPEKFGGEVPIVEISAIQNKGIDDLLETILLLRDLHNLKVEIDKPGKGYILEVFKDKKRGILALGILNEGKINYGDYLITKTTFCKIKIFEDSFGKILNQALPSMPFFVGNFDIAPLIGEEFQVSQNNIEEIRKELEEKERKFQRRFIFEKENIDKFLIIKADNIGSLEALENIFEKIKKENNIKLEIVKADIGPINFEDIDLAKDLNAILVSFNLKEDKEILERIKIMNLLLLKSDIIYEIEKEFLNLIQEETKKIETKFEVLATFSKTRTKKTVGGRVLTGILKLNQKVKILRNEEIIGSGKIISLEKDKNPVQELKENEIGGLILETRIDIEKNDILLG